MILKDRIITTKVLEEKTDVVSIYAIQVKLKKEVKLKFWENLEELLLQEIPRQKKIVIGGDLTGYACGEVN